jgi:FlaA1/EpsC-like NDP-sugar epimerase
VISNLDGVDWHRFLARPHLPAPPFQVLDALRNKRILVTGAAGSIGSALAMRLVLLRPRSLVLLDRSESRLFALRKALTDGPANIPPTFVLGDVGDRALLEEIFAPHAPSLIFHAAACKHVPLLEEQPFAAVENNVFGTETLVSMANKHGARVLLLSTDKAVRPQSVMGATKYIAEKIVRAARGTVLRLGNVLASSDSVAEVFAEKLLVGEPLTVTDPAARRYFLTIEEAVNLLLAASGAPEPDDLFVPNLAKQRYIADLARFMTREVAPGQEAEIAFTRLRPGDKEYEEFCSPEEIARPAGALGLLSVASPQIDSSELQRELGRLHAAFAARDLPALLTQLRRLVPSYAPSAAVLSFAGSSAAAVTS